MLSVVAFPDSSRQSAYVPVVTVSALLESHQRKQINLYGPTYEAIAAAEYQSIHLTGSLAGSAPRGLPVTNGDEIGARQWL